MESSRQAHDDWLRLKLDELDGVEERIAAARPRNQIRERLLGLFLVPLLIGTGVVISAEPVLMVSSAFGLVAFVSVTAFVAIVSPRHRLRVLQWRRDELLAQLGANPTPDVGCNRPIR